MKRLNLRFTKPKIALAAVALVLVITIGYITYSLLSWHQYPERLVKNHDYLKQQVERVIADKQIGQLDESLRDMDCRPAPLTGWQQQLVDDWRDATKQCRVGKENVAALQTQLIRAIDYQQAHDQIQAELAKVSGLPAEQTEETWQESLEAWASLTETVKSLEINQAAAPLQKATLEAAEQIHQRWQELIDASQAEDENAYYEAEAELIGAYGLMEQIAKVDSEQKDKLLVAIKTSYEKAFGDKL